MTEAFPESAITELIIGKAIRVHRRLGPGLLEKTYEECLAYELRKSGFVVEQQKHLPLSYDDLHLIDAYRIDLFVNDSIIIELKTVDKLTSLHAAQILTYLRLSNQKVGLLMNFTTEILKNGVQRVINERPKASAISAPLRPPSIISP